MIANFFCVRWNFAMPHWKSGELNLDQPMAGRKMGLASFFSEHGDGFPCPWTPHPATDVGILETNPDPMPFRSSSMPSLSRTVISAPSAPNPLPHRALWVRCSTLLTRTKTEHIINGVFVWNRGFCNLVWKEWRKIRSGCYQSSRLNWEVENYSTKCGQSISV